MNLLIVDDEHHIVNYLEMLVGEHIEEELEIYKSFSGEQALEILTSIKIDIIFLDIQMPEMTGLELAKRIAQTWPHCHIIFLTAYDSFQYIYQMKEIPNAIYLLKTESDQVIIDTLKHALQSIQQEYMRNTILNDTLKKNQYLLYLSQQHFLRILLSGMSMETIHAEYSYAQSECILDIDKSFYLMYMNIRYRNLSEHHNQDYLQILNCLQIADYQLGSKFTIALLRLDNGDFIWFLQQIANTGFGLSTPDLYLKNAANSLAIDFNNYLHRKTTLFLYHFEIACSRASKVFHFYQRQLDETDYIADSYSQVILYTDINLNLPSPEITEKKEVEDCLSELSYYLQHGKKPDFLQRLEFFKKLCQSRHNMHNLFSIRIYNSIALTLLNYIDTYQLQEVISSHVAIYPLYYIHKFSDWSSAFQYLQKCSACIFEIMAQKSSNRSTMVIDKIKKYIHDNLNQPLNLSTIATLVNYNETYVSRIFRQNTGLKLSDYIFQERITKAKQLLTTTNESINAIATITGFDSIHYFSYAFKKAMGMSPSEYRRSTI